MSEFAIGTHEPPSEDVCFTRGAYRAMLEAATASGYRFIPYGEVGDKDGHRLCILRHDVDIDPSAAVELAEIEHDLGVSATYFVMTRSAVYNPFSRANHLLLRKIVDLGHWIGLHYDVAFRPDATSVADWIDREAEVLRLMLTTEVGVVSFHQPMLSENSPEDIRVEGLVSAFNYAGFTYVSDANKAMHERSFIQLFRDAQAARLHLCIHAEWWATDDSLASSHDLWDAALLRNLYRSQAQILKTERGYGQPRTFIITRS